MAWLSGWNVRYPATIQENSGSDLSDHQVGEISLQGNDPGQPGYVDFGRFKTGGADLRCTDKDGVTLLNFWIRDWDDGARTANIWVKLASLSASQMRTIHLYGANSGATAISNYDNTLTRIANDDSGLKALWHMNEGDPSPTVADDSANNNDGTITGATWQGADGGNFGPHDQQFGNGDHLFFNGTNNYVNCGNDSSLQGGSAFSIVAWVYPVTAGEGSYGRILNKSSSEWDFGLGNGSGTKLLFKVNNVNLFSEAGSIVGAWHHVAVTYQAGVGAKFYGSLVIPVVMETEYKTINRRMFQGSNAFQINSN